MALVKFGFGIAEMRGSIGGDTFSRNRSGPYVRNRTSPINPQSARQQFVRNSMAMLSARWSGTLTANQRTAWNLYASSVVMKNKIGQDIFLTGFNHYIRGNIPFLDLGRDIVDDGPVIFELPAKDPAFAITCDEATQTVAFAFDDTLPWASEDNAILYFLQGKPQNAQVEFFGGPWRGRSGKVGSAGVPLVSPLDFATIFVMSEGQHIWVQARIIRADGRCSEPFRDDTFCVA